MEELKAQLIEEGKIAELNFESGIEVKGMVQQILTHNDKIILITFQDCTVKESNGNILFQPEWGTYDMAVGEKIISVFNGAADKDAYEEITHVSEKQTEKLVLAPALQKLHKIYESVRVIREGQHSYDQLPTLFESLKTSFRQDWLCALEILEILYYTGSNTELEKEIRIYLEMKASNEKEHKKLINDGMHVIANPVTQLITEED